jgi:hypothetical protein
MARKRRKIIRIRNGEVEIKSERLNLDNFLEAMRIAAQRHFGIPNEKKIREWAKKMLLPVGYEEWYSKKKGKKRQK